MALTSARCSKCGTSLLMLSLRCLARTLTRWTLSHSGCTEPPRLKLIFGDFEPLLYCLSSSSVALLGPGWSSLYSSKCRNNSGKLRASLGESRGLHPYLSVLRWYMIDWVFVDSKLLFWSSGWFLRFACPDKEEWHKQSICTERFIEWNYLYHKVIVDIHLTTCCISGTRTHILKILSGNQEFWGWGTLAVPCRWLFQVRHQNDVVVCWDRISLLKCKRRHTWLSFHWVNQAVQPARRGETKASIQQLQPRYYEWTLNDMRRTKRRLAQ